MTALALFLTIAAIIFVVGAYAFLLAFWLVLGLIVWVIKPLKRIW